jgi:hypothetical protein
MNEFAALLYDMIAFRAGRTKNTSLMQQNTSHFSGCGNMEKSDLVELIMSSYFFYADCVFKGLKNGRTGLVSSMKKTILCQPIILLASRPQLNQQTTRRPSRTILPLKEY